MIVGFIFSATSLTIAKNTGSKIIYSVFMGLTALALALSFSRAAWLIAIFVGFVTSLILVRRYGVHNFIRKAKWLLVGGLVLLLLFTIMFQDTLTARIGSFFNNNRSFLSRAYLYGAAWQLFTVKPVLGWGPNNFQYLYGRYINVDFFRLYPPSEEYIYHAHNEYLQLLSETGALTFLAWCAIPVLVVFYSWRLTAGAAPQRTLVTGISMALLGLLGHGAVSMNLRYLMFQVLFWTILGLLATLPLKQQQKEKKPANARLLTAVTTAMVAFCALLMFLQPFLGSAMARMGKHFSDQGNFQLAEPALRQGLLFLPDDLVLLDSLAFVLYTTNRHPKAESLLRQIRQLSPAFGNSDFKLGLILSARQQLDDARLHLNRAKVIEPGNIEILFNAANLSIKMGQLAEAETDLNQALTIQPELISSYDWQLLMGVVLAKRQNLGGAVLHLRRAVQINPQRPEAQIALQRLNATSSQTD